MAHAQHPPPSFASGRGGLILVVTLRVRRTALAAFRDYERQAAKLLASHGARIERAVELASNDDDVFEELHLVRFPDSESFSAYQDDPRTRALAPLREGVIVSTRIVPATDAHDYHLSP